ncbi:MULTISPECIES: hypothetical protein [Clostridium]|uniref:hypothetical protein n=1 Tax=Clostridium sp. ATCC 25772 TaxID=1676991 RepID=UPI0012FC4450|nr:hypothetical protein [Clostridium sp. ATCC 25772]
MDMILVWIVVSILVFTLLVCIINVLSGVQTKNIELDFSTKSFKLKIETKEKSTPSSQD